jgi:hypothetical protein
LLGLARGRLGEFFPNGQLFTFGSFSSQLCKYFDKNGLGYTIGSFFKESSGHPDFKEKNFAQCKSRSSPHLRRRSFSPEKKVTIFVFSTQTKL